MGVEGCTLLFIAMGSIAGFVSCFLLGFSFDTIAPNQMGIMFDQNTGLLDCSTVYGAGRNQGTRRVFTGLGRGFYSYRFPLTAQNEIYSNTFAGATSPSLTTKTSEGATITMDLAVQYALPRTQPQLCNLVKTFGTNYNTFADVYIRSVSRNAISQFAVYDLYQRRTVVGNAVKSAVQAALTNIGFTFIGSQLLSLDIPVALQNEIMTTTVQAQGVFQAQLNLQLQNVTEITVQLQAQVTAQVAVITATAGATATMLSANAAATNINVTTFAEAASYAAFRGALPFNNNSAGGAASMAPADVVALAWLDAITTANVQILSVAAPLPALAQLS